MKLFVDELEQMVADRRKRLPFIQAALAYQPDMSRWSDEGRAEFVQIIMDGLSQQIALCAHLQGTKLVID